MVLQLDSSKETNGLDNQRMNVAQGLDNPWMNYEQELDNSLLKDLCIGVRDLTLEHLCIKLDNSQKTDVIHWS